MNDRRVLAQLFRALIVAAILSIAVILLVPSSPVPWLIVRVVALILIPSACFAGPLRAARNLRGTKS